MMFHCFTVHSLHRRLQVPDNLPILEERDMLLTRLNDATRTALVMEHVRVDGERSGGHGRIKTGL
jgi:hypothetical protein